MNIIETHELTKRYPVRGGQPRVAVNGLNLNIERGSVFGLIGPNGAGKTTTMRMLATLLEPSGGDALVAGASITHEVPRVRRAIGYMPDFFGVYTDMTCAETGTSSPTICCNLSIWPTANTTRSTSCRAA
jgi:ABC-2 type transport system ATP-binding protein